MKVVCDINLSSIILYLNDLRIVLNTLKEQATSYVYDDIDRLDLIVGRASFFRNVFTPFFRRLQELCLRFRGEVTSGSAVSDISEETKEERSSEAALYAFIEGIKDEVPLTARLTSTGHPLLLYVASLTDSTLALFPVSQSVSRSVSPTKDLFVEAGNAFKMKSKSKNDGYIYIGRENDDRSEREIIDNKIASIKSPKARFSRVPIISLEVRATSDPRLRI